MKQRISVFNIGIYSFFILLCLSTLYPLWYCVVGSFTRFSEFVQTTFLLFPAKATTIAYQNIAARGIIFRPMLNTVLITAIGTPASVLACAYTAYGLSKRFPGSTAIMMIMLFSMFVPAAGQLIPRYLLYKHLGLLNTYAVYIVPSLIGIFNIIIFRTSFMDFEYGLVESAKIEGASELRVFFTIVLPLSKGMLAAIGLFMAVGYWNTMTPSLFFVTDQKKKLLQEILYRIVTRRMEASGVSTPENMLTKLPVYEETIRLANIVVTTVPILILYPFLQRYFAKGVMIGAVRG